MPKHDCHVVIDSREGKLAPMIGQCEGFRVTAMDCGDIAFEVNGQLVAIGERKEVNDMVSSVFDGRYMLQRAKLIDLRKQQPGLLVFYLFEGDIFRNIDWSLFKTLKPSSLTSIWNENAMLYGLINIFTANLKGTVEWISTTQQHYIKHGSPEHNVILSNPARYAKVEKCRDLISAKTSMLTAINGVTYDTACKIFSRYSSLPDLLRAYRGTGSEKERCNLLADLLRSDEPKAHRIGPALSARIYRSLYSLQEGEELRRKAEDVQTEPVSPLSQKKFLKAKKTTVKTKRRVMRDDSPVRKPIQFVKID